MSLLLEIVTPDGVALSSPVDSVTMDTIDGQLTILASHQPLMGQTVAGELLYKDKTGSHVYAIDTGFYLLKGDKLSLLVEGAVDSAAIDLAAIKDAQERAKAALASAKKMDPTEIEEFERIVRFSIAQQLIKARKQVL
jgi:F-type H+-transporting ATPase subunit epsilon